MFYIVQPYSDGPNRFHRATIVSSHGTADEAFRKLEQVGETLMRHGLAGDVIHLFVVDEKRQLVKLGH